MSLLYGHGTRSPRIVLPSVLQRHFRCIMPSVVQQSRLTHCLVANLWSNHQRSLLQGRPQREIERHYALSSRPGSQTGRFGLLALKISLGGAALWFTLVAALSCWDSMYPPQFASWPEQIRKQLAQARAAIMLTSTDEILPYLESAWKAARDPSVLGRAWDPDSSVKFLSVAMWLSDELERAGDDREAYRILCDAMNIYESRRRKQRETDSSDPFGPEESKERLHLISVLMKLNGLSGKHEPTAEDKWMLLAIHETTPLLLLCHGLPKEVFEIFGGLERLVTAGSTSTGIAQPLKGNAAAPSVSTKPEPFEEDSSHNLAIPEDEVSGEDDFLSLPTWCLRDIPSAIALPLKAFADVMEKHGHFLAALTTYDLACYTSWLESISQNESPFQTWEKGFRSLEHLSYKAGFMLRHLDIPCHLDNWYYPELGFIDPGTLQVPLESLKFLDDIEKKRTKLVKRKWVHRYRLYGTLTALAMKNNANFHEKVGDLDEALKEYQLSMQLLELSKQPGNSQEIRDIQQRLKAVELRIAEGDTSVDPQLDPVIIARWMEAKKQQEAKGSKDGVAAS